MIHLNIDMHNQFMIRFNREDHKKDLSKTKQIIALNNNQEINNNNILKVIRSLTLNRNAKYFKSLKKENYYFQKNDL